ncbi:MAG: hypothetical protein CMN25_08410 [Salinicola sp.]|uniref:hypothetical protein n=1 Tax=uncultured Salinicola sp. TaxID=1193542 RepID=UPI000C99572E|nr:hypothetical protein [uncultured Salinicola sp.]MAM57341.1 hypothetical protein [Salinicola sp.]|tara:strand:- start:31 stop:240 length:210 start_codon:yes stop_codon:yes gene_type:complete
MYQDPKRVRQRVTVYLDQYEVDVIQSFANLYGLSRAEVMRSMMMKEAAELLGIGDVRGTGVGSIRAKAG